MGRISWKLLVLGGLGYAAFFLLFPDSHPSGRYRLPLSRADAVQRARGIALQSGLPAEGWVAYATVTLDKPSIDYLQGRPEEEGLFVSPVELKVRLAGPDQEHVTVSLSRTGVPIRFEKKRPSRGEDLDDEVRVKPGQIEGALRLLAGEAWDKFSESKEPSVRSRITTLVYEAPELGGPERVPTIRIQAVGDEIYSIVGSAGFSSTLSRSRSDRGDPLEVLLVLLVLAATVLVVAGLARYIFALYERSVRPRQTLNLIAAVVLIDLVRYGFGEGWQEAGLEGRGFFSSGFEFLAGVLFLTAPLLIATAGAGEILAGPASIPRRIHFDLLLRGKLFHRPIGEALLAGGLVAGAVLCIPYALIALGLFQGRLPEHHDPRHWYALLPVTAALDWYPRGPLLPAFGVVAFLYPWLRERIRRIWLLRLSRIALLGFFLSLWTFEYSLPAALSAGLLSALILDWIHEQSGLLAVASCGILAAVFQNGFAMALQPAPLLSLNGSLVIAAGAGALAIFGIVAFRGARLDLGEEMRGRVEEAEARVARRRAERERLLAEFGVARRAQELMLPDRSPALRGVEIAAVCRPAREVGGDLFDYLRLADGRTGIAVADVSGKGVPAALYMTLAKGLLSSTALYHASPRAIINEVNGHFHGCAQRRVFATLALAVLDPERGVVECARAGHNPILWWQPGDRRLHTVNPSGIGLGLAPNRLFSRSLGIQECRLSEGDVLIVYSDGIPEAMNERREEYGMQRFEKAIRQTAGMQAEQIRDHLMSHVRDFVGETTPSDDITLVVLRFSQDWNSGPATPGL